MKKLSLFLSAALSVLTIDQSFATQTHLSVSDSSLSELNQGFTTVSESSLSELNQSFREESSSLNDIQISRIVATGMTSNQIIRLLNDCETDTGIPSAELNQSLEMGAPMPSPLASNDSANMQTPTKKFTPRNKMFSSVRKSDQSIFASPQYNFLKNELSETIPLSRFDNDLLTQQDLETHKYQPQALSPHKEQKAKRLVRKRIRKVRQGSPLALTNSPTY